MRFVFFVVNKELSLDKKIITNCAGISLVVQMRELSLHILEVVENGITAGGHGIWIDVEEARDKDQ